MLFLEIKLEKIIQTMENLTVAEPVIEPTQKPKLTKEDYNKRPTFYHKINTKSFPIRAGGVLFYRKINNKVDLLLIHNEIRNYYEDFGGTTDKKDNSIQDTISREVDEESNGKFNTEDIKTRLAFARQAYTYQCKYLMYFVKVNHTEAKLTKEDFGDMEIHDGIKRTIDWHPLEEVLTDEFIKKLNPRLNNDYMLKQLKNL
jgi:hypothetical protein